MSKEEKIQEYNNKRLIDELSKMPPMVIATAYLHAINYTLYGEDVTEKWITAVQQSSALEKAYNEGYHDALQRQAQPKTGYWVEENVNGGGRRVFCSECGCPPPFEHVSTGDVYSANGYGVINKTKFCPSCGTRMIEPKESEEEYGNN